MVVGNCCKPSNDSLEGAGTSEVQGMAQLHALQVGGLAGGLAHPQKVAADRALAMSFRRPSGPPAGRGPAGGPRCAGGAGQGTSGMKHMSSILGC